MGDYDAINLFRNLGMNINSDAEYEVPLSSEMTIRGKKLVDYHPSIPQGNMTKVIVPSGIKVIGDSCFTGPDTTHNDYMAGCRLPEGVTELENDAFALCRGLKEITVPSTLKKIGDEAFMYSSIESINLPEGLESIGDRAFMNCRCLKELRIPSTVTSIGENCFSSMGTSLLSVMYGGNDGGTVYLPSSLKEEYTEEYFSSGNLKIKWYKGGKKKQTPALPTKEYKYNDRVSFELPKGYEFRKEKGEDGISAFFIKSHPYTDDDGNKQYRFLCMVADGAFDDNFAPKGKKISDRKLLEATVKDSDCVHYFFLPGTAPAGMMSCTVPKAGTDTDDDNPMGKLATLVMLLSRPFVLNLRVLTEERATLECLCMGTAGSNDDPDYMPKFEGMMTVAQAVRINGKPLQLGTLSHKILEKVFSPRTISYSSSSDISSKLKSVFAPSVEEDLPEKSDEKRAVFDPDLPMDFPLGDVKKPWRTILDRKPKKTDSPNSFDIQLKPSPRYNDVCNGAAYLYFDQVYSGFSEKRENLLKKADEYVQVFRDDGVEVDLESELRQGLIRKAYTLHALKSFVWTSVEYCKSVSADLSDFGIEPCLKLAQFISDHGGVNWKASETINTQVVSSHQLKDAMRPGAGLLWRNEITWYCDDSLNWLINSLLAFEPTMKLIRDYLAERKDQHDAPTDTLRHVLAGWCGLSISCAYNYISQSSGPEDLIPAKTRGLPKNDYQVTVLDERFYMIGDGICFACTEPGDTIEFPEGVKKVNIYDVYKWRSGAREYYNYAKKVIYPSTCEDAGTYPPENAKEIVFKADSDTFHCGWKDSYTHRPCIAERCIILGKANSLGDYCLNSLSKLKEVRLPDGLKRIGKSALYNTSSLDSVVIPPTVEEIGDDAFKDYGGHKKTLIVEKGSIAEETVRKFIDGKDNLTMKLVLSEAEQKLVDEENRLRKIAAGLRHELDLAYKNNLGKDDGVSLESIVSRIISERCDLKTWTDIREKGFPVAPEDFRETERKIDSAPVSESYARLTEWFLQDFSRIASLWKKKNDEIETIRTEEAGLKEELSHLGIFKRRRKKEIAALLETIPGRILEAEEEFEHAKKR